MAARKRRTPEGGGGGEVEEEGGARPRLVLRLRHTAGGGWVCTGGGNDGGGTPGLDLRRGPALTAGLSGSGGHGVDVMRGKNRLVLVLDLDHTLLHSTRIRRLTPEETYLLRQEPCHPAVPEPPTPPPTRAEEGGAAGGCHRPLLFNLEHTVGFLTKLRPFVHTFLREASGMYHLCICTMGKRAYAHEMARILDPDGIYFGPGDVVSRSDFTEEGKKGLDVVPLGDERTTVILDDTVAVWERHPANLIPVPGYHYFACSKCKLNHLGKSLAERRDDEDECTGPLAAALDLLRRVHMMFFDPCTSAGGRGLANRDVRDILRILMGKPADHEPPIILQKERIVVKIKVG